MVVWGEMGRTPRVGTQRGTTAGRDHWPQAGFALLAGGGLQTGQVIGATDPRGEAPRGRPYTPQNILATLYHLLTGDVPFPGATSMEIIDKKAVGFFLPAGSLVTELPESVDRILTRMMARDPLSPVSYYFKNFVIPGAGLLLEG